MMMEIILIWNGSRVSDIVNWLLQVMAWFRQSSQQAITWTNFDTVLCRHMASLGHDEFEWPLFPSNPRDDLIGSYGERQGCSYSQMKGTDIFLHG